MECELFNLNRFYVYRLYIVFTALAVAEEKINFIIFGSAAGRIII
jgi:hypothetical protein